MKITTILNTRKVKTVAEKKELSVNAVISVLTLGEKGRGRKELFIPLPKNIKENEILDDMEFEIGETKSGKVRINRGEEKSTSVIVLLKAIHGFRGSVEYDIKDDIEILGEGQIAQGTAGRMGGNKQLLFILKDKQTISFTRYGRLYGEESKWFVFNENGTIHILPKSEYDLLEE